MHARQINGRDKRYFAATLVVLFALGSRPHVAATSFKRGVAIGTDHPSAADISALTGCVSWGYNWGATYTADQTAVWNEIDYIPMVWNDRDLAMNGSWTGARGAHFNASALLGFNEPNFLEQANLTPQQASAAWRGLEQLADRHQIPIVVSPAMNFNDLDPIEWLDDFFTLCDGCRVDAIARISNSWQW